MAFLSTPARDLQMAVRGHPVSSARPSIPDMRFSLIRLSDALHQLHARSAVHDGPGQPGESEAVAREHNALEAMTPCWRPRCLHTSWQRSMATDPAAFHEHGPSPACNRTRELDPHGRGLGAHLQQCLDDTAQEPLGDEFLVGTGIYLDGDFEPRIAGSTRLTGESGSGSSAAVGVSAR